MRSKVPENCTKSSTRHDAIGYPLRRERAHPGDVLLVGTTGARLLIVDRPLDILDLITYGCQRVMSQSSTGNVHRVPRYALRLRLKPKRLGIGWRGIVHKVNAVTFWTWGPPKQANSN